ncbi:tetratricopeptide repeat protein [uncultured Arcticibacterium sp.]|uniref:tetratricopeptide repeat protein n=1 Tax=uncultured Arcticibacterium sp. TaxID=2173042 RepID=UPI0030FC2D27
MNKLKVVFTFLLVIGYAITYAQSPMDPGFKMLEGGQFEKARDFFADYLKTDSLNQTALLCFGRGTGLAGNTKEAKEVFGKLQKRFPGNYEVDLNMAEAHMWSKDFKTALELYSDLVKRDSTSFAAVLGFANAYSENKEYDNALKYIEKALEIMPGNANAMVSRKYMRLGKASKFSYVGQFEEAISYFDLILDENPKDPDALINKAQALISIKKYEEANEVFETLKTVSGKEVDAYLGMSRIANLQKEPKEALKLIEEGMTFTDSSTVLKASLGKVNALAWNKKFDESFSLLNDLKTAYPNNLDVLAGFGRINIWSKGFAKGAGYFKDLLKDKPGSFDGNLGYADAHHAQGLDDVAFKYVRKTLEYYDEQRDALKFLEKLHVAHDPSISSHIYFSKDNGGNTSENYQVSATYDPSPRFRTSLTYYQRSAKSSVGEIANQKIAVSTISPGLSYKVNGKLKVSGEIGFLNTSQYERVLGMLQADLNVGKFQQFQLKYNQEMQTFTSELIDRNLKLDNITLNYNLSLPSKIGAYSQMIHTQVSDGNVRNLWFASLYYDIKQSPVVKAGFNYSYFSFKKQLPAVYFSPDVFRGYELFVAAENVNEENAKWIYQAIFAGGLQQISTEKSQGIYRFDIKTGWKFSPRFMLMGYYMKSNSAASSVQGFTYNEWGVKTKWVIPFRKL